MYSLESWLPIGCPLIYSFSNAAKMVRMQWWAYLLMLMVYICYLLIGAAVFQTGVRILSLALEITLRKKFFLWFFFLAVIKKPTPVFRSLSHHLRRNAVKTQKPK